VKRAFVIGLAAATVAAGSLSAQERRAIAPQGGGGGRVIAGAVETKITPNRPYAAEAITQTVQIMGDGNRIERTQLVKVYRDTEGRTRRETYNADGTAVQLISISDPVAKNGYTLHPDKKVAYQTSGNVVAVAPMPMPSTTVAGGVATTAGRVVGSGAGSGGGYAATTNPGTPVLRERMAVDDPNVKTEDLGTQNIEGVAATGKRTTTTIPAGKIGNVKDIQIISEQWFSDELQVLVMTRHNDPRSGETTYRLRNILRAEPDAGLFAVPPDYQVERRQIRQPQ
jgi:hypothetical protein